MCKDNKNCIVGGDINIDHCKENDPSSRHELKPLIPLWEEC